MYTYKERKHHLLELHNPEAAADDLELLREKAGSVKQAHLKNPRKHADEIVYALLGVATREEIRANRRKKAAEDGEPSADTKPQKKKKAPKAGKTAAGNGRSTKNTPA